MGQSMAMHSSAIESSALVERLLAQQKHLMDEAKADMAAKDAKMEQQRMEMEARLEQQHVAELARAEQAKVATDAKVELLEQQAMMRSFQQVVSDAQLDALQTRLEALHTAQLLSDEELFSLEDSVADFIEYRSSLDPPVAELGASAKLVKKLVGISEGMPKDGTLARQLRRKFVTQPL